MRRAWCCVACVAFVAGSCGGDSGPSISLPDLNEDAGFDAGQETAAPDAAPEAAGDVAADRTELPHDVAEVAQPCHADADCAGVVPAPCRAVACDPAAGSCVEVPVADFTPCAPKDACDLGGTCKAGACRRTAVDCADADPCTTDACDPAKGCVHTPRTDPGPHTGASTCNDQNACTQVDYCLDGACVGDVNTCPCTADTDCLGRDDGNLCNGTLHCAGGFCAVAPDTVVTCQARGADPCTVATCVPATGQCVTAPRADGTPCDDHDACTQGDVCAAGACVGKDVSKAMCDDGNPCTTDSCNPATGCAFVANDLACSDGNGCTEGDRCAAGKCVGAPTPACGCLKDADCAGFEDGNRCNGTLRCVAGACAVDPATIVACDASKDTDCARAACDPATGQCALQALAEGRPCDDHDACTPASACQVGVCKGVGTLPCDDGNPCTADSCDATDGCVHLPQSAACDDGSVCTLDDQCVDGACKGTPKVCDDGNPCTADFCDPVQGCRAAPSSGACDDGSQCTEGDHCQDGACVGSMSADCDDQDPCTDDLCDPAGGCYHVNNAAPCDDGNACTFGDACQDGACRPGSPVGCDDGNPCTTDTCDPAVGCGHLANALPCDDLNPCTVGDVCQGGACLGPSPADCGDGNPCTDDSCDPAVGCVHVDNQGPCDDGDPCTSGDRCLAGTCRKGTASACDDGDPCTADSCGATGCTHQPATGGTCDDHNACTTGDHCLSGACVGGPRPTCDDGNPCTTDDCDPAQGCIHSANTLPCDDHDACTTQDACFQGQCRGGPAPNCDDGNPCTDDACDPAKGCVGTPNTKPCDDGNACTANDACQAGRCQGTPITCDDGKVCTSDTCLPAVGCVFVANGNPCDDGNPCTVGDLCKNGACTAGAARVCDDGNPCTADTCSPASGCVFAALKDGAACDDGNACTVGDVCLSGRCVGTGPNCDDGNPCTDDRCDNVQGGCYHVNNTAACDDGNACTVGDACLAGQCRGGKALDCGDGNPCTDDLCDATKGCWHANNTVACDDGNKCTTKDTCAAGKCVGGAPPNCDDQNLCTSDACDATLGCTHVPNALSCDDGNACTTSDACQGGTCVGGPPPNCDDGNDCTLDKCLATLGCIHMYTTDACDDGNLCTAGDVCSNGRCVGTAVACDDKNACTTDACDPAKGCVFTPNTQPCDDGKACTVGDACLAGACVGGAPNACDDGNACTDDGCAEPNGCFHANNTASCSDGDACTVGDACKGGQCQPGAAANCDDGNECTVDSCDKATGCRNDNLPIGTPCGTSGWSMCWSGRCVPWEFKTSSYPGSTDTRLYEGGRVDASGALYASGSSNLTVGGSGAVAVASIFAVDEATLGLAVSHTVVKVNGASYLAQGGHVAGGSGGVISHWVPSSTGVAWLESGAPVFPTDLLAATRVGNTALTLLAGRANGGTAPSAVVRACTEDKSYNFQCLPVQVVTDRTNCTGRSPELRGAFATAKRGYVVGFEPSLLDWGMLVIGSTDGTPSKCGTAGTWSDLVIGDKYGLSVSEGPTGPGKLNDVHGLSETDVWAVGEKGTIYYLSAASGGWQRVVPSSAAAGAVAGLAIGQYHRIEAVWDDAESGVHMVGVKETGDLTPCRTPFYLHAVLASGGYAFNNYMEFTPYTVCGANTVRTDLPDVTVDPVTGNVYAFGWVPDDPAKPAANLGLVMRLARPK